MRQICITLMFVMALEKSRRWASTVRLASDWCMFACSYKLYLFLAFISLTTFYIEEVLKYDVDGTSGLTYTFEKYDMTD